MTRTVWRDEAVLFARNGPPLAGESQVELRDDAAALRQAGKQPRPYRRIGAG